MKKLFILMLLSICASRVAAQDASNPLGGDIRASSTNCSVSSSCVWQKLPANATSLTVTVANGPVGSFTGTLQFEQSSNGGFNFSAASPASTTVPGVFTFTVTSFTDFRVRASAFASGDAAVNMQASGPATGPPGPAGPAGGSSVSPNTPTFVKYYDVSNYGAKGGAKRSGSVTLTQLSSTIVDTVSTPFLSSDVGSLIACVNNGGSALTTGNSSATITGFTDSGHISISPQTVIGGIGTVTNQVCVWYPQDDTAAFCCGAGSAYAAAHTSVSGLPGVANFATKTPLGTMTCSGGFAVSNSILVETEAASNTLGVSIAGNNQCYVYLLPSFNAAGGSVISSNNASNFSYTGLILDGNGFTFQSANLGAVIFIGNARNFRVADNHFEDLGTTGGYASGFAVLNITTPSALFKVEKNHIQTGGVAATSGGIYCSGCQGGTFDTNFVSNNFENVYLTGSGNRSPSGGPLLFLNHNGDECGASGVACVQEVSSTIIWKGGYLFGDALSGTQPALALDTSSEADTDGVNIGAFNSGGNICAVQLSGNAKIFSTNTTWRGNGTSAAICGPSTSAYNDAGNNQIQNCAGTTCNPVTVAQYATLGFSGGIVPNASIQMPQNTCNAVNGNLLATAQNLCSFVLTKNQQLTAIAAQSGGTTPANSACATPPVITLSDGTRTATMTMTTGKTFWTGTVDAVTNINQVFASGTTLTVSIGANTCATPPVNVSVTYSLQSVLNP